MSTTTHLYQKIYMNFKENIENGRLQKGTKLPSIRQMTRDSSVSRTTVENAYQQLCADGYIICKPQSGYYVNEPNLREKPVKKFKAETHNENYLYDFSGKKMDDNTFDFNLWRKYLKNSLSESQHFMAYGAPEGEIKLRQQISNYLSAGRGVYSSSNNIIIGAGVQSLLHILCEIIDKNNTVIAFEDPGFSKGHCIFKDHAIKSVFIKGDETGIDTVALYKSGANMLYISPSHSFPSGATLPYFKRKELLEWAENVNGIIIEDDYDGELKYSGKPLATLASLDKNGRVFYLGTFSKLLPPSIRISYIVIPDTFLDKYENISSQYNQTSSTIEQLTLASYIESGQLEKQVRRLRRIYSRKNDIITKAFEKYFGSKAIVFPNDTGLHVIVSIKTNKSAEEISEMAKNISMNIIPMSNYKFENKNLATAEIYMSCASIKEEEISRAVWNLSKIII